jgi:predicted AlkP superfamily phosphohydrolase/phosphomutase
MQGSPAPDALLVGLDGKEISLLESFVKKMPKGMPLILNMGSFT